MRQSTIFWIILVVALVGGGIIFAAVSYKGKTNYSPPQNNTNMNTELQKEDVKVGSGPAAKTGDSVSVHYTGTFADGNKFDSSLDRGQPFTFTLGGQVIQGWNEGVVGMQVGGVRKLVIPPALGYGASDYGPIPGNSTLYFTIELLKIGS